MADVLMTENTPCKFKVAWVGICKKPSTNGWCSEHEELACVSCGQKATKTCDFTGQFVCGEPLCDDCKHGHISLKDCRGFLGMGGGHVTSEAYNQELERRKEQGQAY